MPEGDRTCSDGGQMGILADHENMVIAIEVGEAKMQLEDGTWETLAVGTGFLEVVNNRVTMLVQTAEKPEEIDARRQKNGVKSWKKNFVRSRVSRNTITRKHPCKSHEPVEGVKGEEYEDIMMPGSKVNKHVVLAHKCLYDLVNPPQYENKSGAQATRYSNIG